MRVKDLKEHLESYDDNDVIAWMLWIPNDAIVLHRETYSTNDELTQKEAEHAIEQMHHYADTSIGMSWEVLAEYI